MKGVTNNGHNVLSTWGMPGFVLSMFYIDLFISHSYSPLHIRFCCQVHLAGNKTEAQQGESNLPVVTVCRWQSLGSSPVMWV